MGMSGFDLRKFQYDGEGAEKAEEIFGKLVSGKTGYKTVIDRNKPVKRCSCGQVVEDCKFCPECGAKVVEEEENKLE